MTRFLLTVCLAATMTMPSVPALEQAELAKFEEQTQATSLLNGDAYIKSREALESAYKGRPEYIKHLAVSGTNWQIRLVAAIVIERAERKDAVHAFLDWKHAVPYDRAATRRIQAMGKAIAENANAIPMFLIEAFWKQNELDPDPRKTRFFKADPQWAYLASAMGQMKLSKARPALEEALGDKFYEGKSNPMYVEIWVSVVKTEVAKALGAIGAPESVPRLLQTVEKDPKVEDRSTLYAVGALISCADSTSEEFLTRRLSATGDEDIKARIRSLLQEIEKKAEKQAP